MLLPEDPGDAAARLRQGGAEVIQIRLSRVRASWRPGLHARLALGFAPEVMAIRKVIRDQAIDLVLVNGLLNPQGAIAAALERVALVWQVVDSAMPGLLRVTTMALLRHIADAAMFNGKAVAKSLIGARPLAIPNAVYYPPVDTQLFVRSGKRRAQIRTMLGIPNSAVVVGTVANVNPQKGIEYFVRTGAVLWSSYKNLWFLVVGARHRNHQGYLAKLEREIAASGIGRERWIFTGERPDVENFYAAMDVKLITSPRWEGTTTTAIEAMACEVPVVATDVGAIKEVVTDGVTGHLVEPRNPEAMAGAVLRLLADEKRRERLVREGRRRAEDLFDVRKCADLHAEIFNLAVAHRRMKERMRKGIVVEERTTSEEDPDAGM